MSLLQRTPGHATMDQSQNIGKKVTCWDKMGEDGWFKLP